MPIKTLRHQDGTILCLWVPSSLLQEGLDILKTWGFNHKQVWIWIKIKKNIIKKFKINLNQVNWDDFLSFGMGSLGRNVHEVVLVGTYGKIYKKLKNKSQRTVFFAENTKHSKKPEILQDKLEIMFPGQNYLEIFGRRLRKNWIVIGNESPTTIGEDIFDSLDNLIKI